MHCKGLLALNVVLNVQIPLGNLSHLPQQRPGVFAQVGADGSQQECLVLNKAEHKISVHALDGQLSVFILRSLRQNRNGGKGIYAHC